MDPSMVIDSITEYTQNDYKIDMGLMIVSNSVVYDIVGFILGLLTFVIIVGLGLITALDIAFITIPMFRSSVIKRRWDGSNGVGKFRIISNDARLSVLSAETNPDMSALSVYLKRRIKTYVASAVIIYVNIVGSNIIISIISKIVIGILEAFTGFAYS